MFGRKKALQDLRAAVQNIAADFHWRMNRLENVVSETAASVRAAVEAHLGRDQTFIQAAKDYKTSAETYKTVADKLIEALKTKVPDASSPDLDAIVTELGAADAGLSTATDDFTKGHDALVDASATLSAAVA